MQENSPASQAVLNEPNFEILEYFMAILAELNIWEKLYYREEISFFVKVLFLGERKNKVPSCWKLNFTY